MQGLRVSAPARAQSAAGEGISFVEQAAVGFLQLGALR